MSILEKKFKMMKSVLSNLVNKTTGIEKYLDKLFIGIHLYTVEKEHKWIQYI